MNKQPLRLNILELHRIINSKNEKKNECYEKVLSICHRKITMATENKQLRCLFEVPEYIVGYPIYDLPSCIKYILDSLQNNGFLVKYYFPRVLYISWDFKEMKTEKESIQQSNNLATTNLLISKKPTVTLNKKSTGKYSLKF